MKVNLLKMNVLKRIRNIFVWFDLLRRQNVPNACATILECVAYLILRRKRSENRVSDRPASQEPFLDVPAYDAEASYIDNASYIQNDYFHVPINYHVLLVWIICGPVAFTCLLLVVMLWQGNYIEFIAFGIALVLGALLHEVLGYCRLRRPDWFVRSEPPGDIQSVRKVCDERSPFFAAPGSSFGGSVREMTGSPYAYGFVDAVGLANQFLAAEERGSVLIFSNQTFMLQLSLIPMYIIFHIQCFQFLFSCLSHYGGLMRLMRHCESKLLARRQILARGKLYFQPVQCLDRPSLATNIKHNSNLQKYLIFKRIIICYFLISRYRKAISLFF